MGVTFDDFDSFEEPTPEPQGEPVLSGLPDVSRLRDQELVELLGEIMLETIARRSQREG